MRRAKLQPLLVVLFLSAGIVCAATSRFQQSPQDQAPPNQQANLDASTATGTDPASAADPVATGSRYTLPAGSVIEIRIADVINSSKGKSGDLVTGTVDPSVFYQDHVIIPRGTEAHVRLMFDKKGHPLGGDAKVELELVALVLNKQKIDIFTDDYSKNQKPLSAKLHSTGLAGASTSPGVATSGAPETAGISPVVAAFTAARVVIPAGTRIKFTVQSPFTFAVPANAGTGS